MAVKLGGRKSGIAIGFGVFLVAAAAGLGIAQVLGAATTPGTVTIGGALCDPIASQNSTCLNCLVDFGSDNTWCWSTQCDDQLLGWRACRTWANSTSPCVSNAIATVQCNNCKSWKCSPINPPDAGHSTPWCDIGTCRCPNTTPDWTGAWSTWPICNG